MFCPSGMGRTEFIFTLHILKKIGSVLDIFQQKNLSELLKREGITSEVWQISRILFKEKAILAFDQVDHTLLPMYLGLEML